MRKTRHIIRHLLLAATVAAALATTTRAATLLDAPVHADIGVGFDPMGIGSARWDLHIHQEEPTVMEFEPGEAIFYVNELAAATSPGGTFETLLGPMGTPNWILPEAPNPNLLRLGFGTEEITTAGLFVGDEITLTLVSVSGPGEFAVWQDNLFAPIVRFNTRDGITGSDAFTFAINSHAEHNFAFSAQGTYEIGIRASGTLVAGSEFTQSEIATYTFQVVPEPSTWALLIGGAAVLGGVMRRRLA